MVDVIFRLDAGGYFGCGHLTRCTAFAEAFLRRGLTVGFWGCVDLALLSDSLKSQVVFLDRANKPSARLFIVDTYEPLDSLWTHISPDAPVILLDDETGRTTSRPCMVVNPFGDASVMAQNFPNAEIYVGLQYVCVRSSVKEARRRYQNRVSSSTQTVNFGQKIVVTLGATDQSALLRQILDVFLSSNKQNSRLEVYAPAAIHVSKGHGKVSFHPLSSSFLEVCADTANLVVCGAGQTLVEMAYIGLPVIGLVFVANQRRCGQVLADHGVSVLDRENMPDLLEEYLEKMNQNVAGGFMNPGRYSHIGQAEEQLIERMCECVK